MVSTTPRPLYRRERPGPIVQEVGWATRPVWTCAKTLAPTGIRPPHRPARRQSLYRLSYPAHGWKWNRVYYTVEQLGFAMQKSKDHHRTGHDGPEGGRGERHVTSALPPRTTLGTNCTGGWVGP
jgi:hypothetical protein